MKSKICNMCNIEKTLNKFHKQKAYRLGVSSVCKDCRNKMSREYYYSTLDHQRERSKNYRQKNKIDISKRDKEYRRSLHGKASNIFTQMQSRLEDKNKPTYTNRKCEFTKKEFMDWILNNPDYKRLHKQWVNSEYEYKLTPSLDRILNTGNYTFNNIQIITLQQNSSKPKNNWLTFEEAKELIRKYNFNSSKEYIRERTNISKRLPSDPYRVYKNKWLGWSNFLKCLH